MKVMSRMDEPSGRLKAPGAAAGKPCRHSTEKRKLFCGRRDKKRGRNCESVHRVLRLSFFECKMIDKILEHGQVHNGQICELHSATSDADLLPRVFGKLLIIYDFALDPVYVDEMAVAAEYFYL